MGVSTGVFTALPPPKPVNRGWCLPCAADSREAIRQKLLEPNHAPGVLPPSAIVYFFPPPGKEGQKPSLESGISVQNSR